MKEMKAETPTRDIKEFCESIENIAAAGNDRASAIQVFHYLDATVKALSSVFDKTSRHHPIFICMLRDGNYDATKH